MKQNKLGKFSEEAQNVEERAKQKELAEEERSKSMKIGDRCEVKVLRQPTKRGSVMFIGNFQPYIFSSFTEFWTRCLNLVPLKWTRC